MKNLLKHLTFQGRQRSRCAGSARSDWNVRPQVEALESRELMSITDMTGVASLFPRHSGPTVIYLNFDGNSAQGVSAFQSTTGNIASDIHEILFRVSEMYAPFDVQVERIYGNGNLDSSSNGNSTIFIGEKSGNGTGANDVAYAYTPFANSDYPGSIQGTTHRPNSDSYDVAYVDPISGYRNPVTLQVIYSSWSNTTIARAIAHEAGHTFGLAHVLSNPSQEIMSYDAANVRFNNQTFNITTLNNSGTSTAPDSRLQPQWYVNVPLGIYGLSYKVPVNITTQNSYTYLQTVLGARSTSGDLANVADNTAVDSTYVDGGMWAATPGFNLTAYLQRSGDFDVYALSTPTSQTVQIDLKQIAGSTIDPVVMIFSANGQNLLAFNDDGGGFPNSRLLFATTAGQSYRIVVGSYGEISTGGYQLTVNTYYQVNYPFGVLQQSAVFTTSQQFAFTGQPTPVSTASFRETVGGGARGAGAGAIDAAFASGDSLHSLVGPDVVRQLQINVRTGIDLHLAGLTQALSDSPLRLHL